MRDETLPLDHFEAFYQRGPDPWGFASSPYEARKYARTLAALPRAHYGRAFEVGCSIGVFTAMLAGRCDSLLAVEPVVAALDAARQRNADRPHVRFAAMFVPGDWPPESFDLVVLSEVLDYLGGADLIRLAERLRAGVAPAGDVVLVHWLGKKRSTAPKPTEASAVLIEAVADCFQVVEQERNADYRLDVLRRR